jgi:uncharacterized protein YneF (UPF0154 family)
MDFSILSQINYLAVAVSTLAFFFIGSLWFGAFFGKMWIAELARHNTIIKEPSKSEIFAKMGLNLLKNAVISLAMACLVILVGSTTAASGLVLGLFVACGFAASAMADIFIWESRSFKLFIIDSGYQIVGITLAAIILSVWQ